MRITIEEGISDTLALELVQQVVKQGRISTGRNGKKVYCFVTVFGNPKDKDEYVVYVSGDTKDDCFKVFKKRVK